MPRCDTLHILLRVHRVLHRHNGRCRYVRSFGAGSPLSRPADSTSLSAFTSGWAHRVEPPPWVRRLHVNAPRKVQLAG